MSGRAVAHAHWVSHVNGVNPPRQMRKWLTDRKSLTVKLMEHSRHFRVRRLHQKRGFCLPDEHAIVALPHRVCVREREVLLECDGHAVVFAHTVVPLSATASDWPFFGMLGERSLGTTLFGDPRVKRGALQYARLRAEHPLSRRIQAVLDKEVQDFPLFARRCLYRRKNGLLLVTEVFLPAVATLRACLAGKQDGISKCRYF